MDGYYNKDNYYDDDNIKSKEELFDAIGLQKTDFGNERKGGDFSIVHCSFSNHAFVMIIDKTKEWEDTIKPETDSIYLIDSSLRTTEAIKQNPKFCFLLKCFSCCATIVASTLPGVEPGKPSGTARLFIILTFFS